MTGSGSPSIRKVLIANRGEIAIRVGLTCREKGLGTVAVYSDADFDAPHRHFADEAVHIGESPASASYLRIDRILEAAELTGADAIHPGYGFLSENAAFARAVEGAGKIFIGPTPEQIEAMGDKVQARELMARSGVPVIPGSDGPVADLSDLQRVAKEIGFPVLLKAAGGGGGKGIRRVDRPKELEEAWKRAESESQSSFGDSRVYVEKLLEGSRHIEAQVFGDGRGGVAFYGERECSLQRNHQKVLEETPSPALDEPTRSALREAALAGTRAISYRGAGTMEFLYDPVSKEFYFLEMNTRLQVEHPVTEMVTRLDLVAEQLRIAEGGAIESAEDPERRGASLELRVCAEDPFRGFAPSTGTIRGLRLPHSPFTRFDGALRDGDVVTPFYDPLLGKLIVWGRDRAEAIRRLETAIVRMRIGGIHTTLPLGLEICRRDEFRRGEFHTRSLESWLDRTHVPETTPQVQVLLAGIVARHSLGGGAEGARRPGPLERGRWGLASRLERGSH